MQYAAATWRVVMSCAVQVAGSREAAAVWYSRPTELTW